MSDTFLKPEELVELTGACFKEKQKETLRKMRVPFYVNANGRAVVARAVIVNPQIVQPVTGRGWSPRPALV